MILLLLEPALKFYEGKEKKYFLHALIAFVSDVIIAHTSFVKFAGKPGKSEWTISQVTERLAKDDSHPNQKFFIELAKMINSKSPTGKHINLD